MTQIHLQDIESELHFAPIEHIPVYVRGNNPDLVSLFNDLYAE